jgi:DNA-directed RNA polymerase subunit RPC12/RpoP
MPATATPKKTAAKKPGRPKGSKNADAPTAEGQLTRCPRCGSTQRGRYLPRRELEHAGEEGGEPYTHTVWRRCRCENCGQHRVDRHRENRP